MVWMKVKYTYKIVNIVATANTGYPIDINKIHDTEYLDYDTWDSDPSMNRYVGIHIPGLKAKGITIFHNGNLISRGNNSIAEVEHDILLAIKFLKRFKGKLTYPSMIKKPKSASP